MDDPTVQRDEPIVELLDQVWTSVSRLCSGLDAEQWRLPTDLPGWDVKDCLSHMTGVEAMLLGDPVPEASVDHLEHVKNDFAAMIEVPVQARRPLPPDEVLAEFDACTSRRLDVLRSLSASEWDQVGWSPVGQVPYREFMAVRVFDCWMHEQDIRRAVGRPGHLEGGAADLSVGRIRKAMGGVVGKRAGAPDGTTVVFEVTGPARVTFALEVDGRATELSSVPDAPTVHLRFDTETFCAVAGGRWHADRAADNGATVLGDSPLGQRILGSMAITP